jgi:hypothetical protein
MNYKMLMATAIIAAAMVLAFGLKPQVAHADGSSAGMQAAREDFRNGAGYQGSCADHGYDVTQYPGWCLGFKSGYAAEWAILEIGK